jgi:CelD/BcsL family acetyltransferase involved in cellulose biosynthesis
MRWGRRSAHARRGCRPGTNRPGADRSCCWSKPWGCPSRSRVSRCNEPGLSAPSDWPGTVRATTAVCPPATRPQWRLDLAQLPVGDPVAGQLLAALSGARLEPDQSSPVLTFAEGQDRHERFFTARILREVRRGQRKLDQAGVAAEVRRISSPVGVRRLLPAVVAMRRARDHAVGRRSHLDGRRARSFYVNAVQALADAGQAEIWTLNVEGTLGAYFVGVRDGSSYRILDGRMSTQWGSASLALLLRAELIGELLSDPGIKEVDYMRGVLHHKMQDASRVVPAERLTAESSTRVATLAREWSALRQSLARRVPVQTRRWILSLVRVGGGSSRSSRAAPAEAQEVPPRPGA